MPDKNRNMNRAPKKNLVYIICTLLALQVTMGKHSAAVRRCYTRQRMAGRAGASALYCCGCGEQVPYKADRLLKHANGCQALSRTRKWRPQRDVLQQVAAVSSDGADTTIANFFFSYNVAFSSIEDPSFRNSLQRLAQLGDRRTF